MEELSWYVGARITRDRAGNVHWFVESSDGLSGGHLVDEGAPVSVISAIHMVRQASYMEFFRLHNGLQQELPFG